MRVRSHVMLPLRRFQPRPAAPATEATTPAGATSAGTRGAQAQGFLGGLFSAVAGWFGPGAEALAATEEAVARLENSGLEFQQRGRILFWYTGWKPGDSKRLAKTLHKGKTDRVRVSKPGLDWQALRVPSDVEVLDSFYGHRRTGDLDKPPLGRVLSAMELRGTKFSAYSNGDTVGGFGAYRMLTGTDSEHTKLQALTGPERVSLDSGDEVLAAGYFRDLAQAEELDKPGVATTLKGLAAGGYTFEQGSPLECYRGFRGVQVMHRGSVLAELGRPEMEQPHRALSRVMGRRSGHDRLAASMDGEDLRWGWDLVRHLEDPRVLVEHCEFLSSLWEAEPADSEVVYNLVLEKVGPGERLRQVGGLAAAAAGALGPGAETEEIETALEHLREVVPRLSSQAGPYERTHRYLDLLADTGDPAVSLKALETLS